MKRDPTLYEYRRMRRDLAATRHQLQEARETIKALEAHEDDLLADMDDVWNAMSQTERDEQCAHPQDPPR